MSTISTQVSLGASYFVNDFYRRFIKNSSEKELVKVGRIFSMLSIILGSFLELYLTSASLVLFIIIRFWKW